MKDWQKLIYLKTLKKKVQKVGESKYEKEENYGEDSDEDYITKEKEKENEDDDDEDDEYYKENYVEKEKEKESEKILLKKRVRTDPVKKSSSKKSKTQSFSNIENRASSPSTLGAVSSTLDNSRTIIFTLGNEVMKSVVPHDIDFAQLQITVLKSKFINDGFIGTVILSSFFLSLDDTIEINATNWEKLKLETKISDVIYIFVKK